LLLLVVRRRCRACRRRCPADILTADSASGNAVLIALLLALLFVGSGSIFRSRCKVKRTAIAELAASACANISSGVL
jgi:hypothetical protein